MRRNEGTRQFADRSNDHSPASSVSPTSGDGSAADSKSAASTSATTASHASSAAVQQATSGRRADDIIVKTANGGEIAVPSRAVAGLSEEYRKIFEERASRGRDMPIVYSNPGAYAQLDRIPDEVISALPPPQRPLWPMQEQEITWKYLRGFSFGLLFVGLALYLHVKSTVKGSARLALERRLPGIAAMLVNAGVIEEYSHIVRDLDRDALFARVFTRYSPESNTIPVHRAVKLLEGLLGDEALQQPTSSATSVTSAASVAATALVEAGLAGKESLSQSEFVKLFSVGSKDLSNVLVYLGSEEMFGIVPSSQAVLNELSVLYDRVIIARSSRNSFSPLALAELASEIGFSTDDASAATFLADSSAVVFGRVKLPSQPPASAAASSSSPAAPNPALASAEPARVPATFAVPVSKTEFVDFLASAAAAANLSDEKVAEYLRVFYMLHMSGIREQAGVRPVGQ